MRVEHMTAACLARFMSANGLRLDGCWLLAPNGETMGIVRHIRGGQIALQLFQEAYCLPDGRQVTAWWPAFRPAWAIAASDGSTEVGEMLGPDEVVCDLCNASITIRPVPVVDGYAHCEACFSGLGVPFPGRIQPYSVLPADEECPACAGLGVACPGATVGMWEGLMPWDDAIRPEACALCSGAGVVPPDVAVEFQMREIAEDE